MRFAQILLGALFAFFGAAFLLEGSARAAARQNGAPLCDDRAASAYAAEPAPQPVDAGDVTPAPDGCKSAMSATESAARTSRDDLQRAPEVHADQAALIGAPVAIPSVVDVGAAHALPTVLGPADEHRLTDNPPPRPIPWRG